MEIYTKKAFKKASAKWFSLRNGTIGEIDALLEEYEDKKKKNDWNGEDELAVVTRLREKVDKFAREKEIKYLVKGTQSEARRRAVAGLREQVYKRMWELYTPRRDDEAFYTSESNDDPGPTRVEKLTKMLRDLRISKRATGGEANRLRSELHRRVEEWLTGDAVRLETEIRAKNLAGQPETAEETALRKAWFYYVKDGRPNDTIRLGMMDLQEVITGQYKFLKYADSSAWTKQMKDALGKMRFGGDGMVGTFVGRHPLVEKLPDDLRNLLGDYIFELLTVEMQDEVALIVEALQGENGYRAVVNIDYYAFRSITNIGLHKDTVGNSVFVALHYMNDNPMMGPEYVDDPAPIRPKDNDGYYPPEVYLRNISETRDGAPWSRISDAPLKHVWPDDLLAALQAARKPPEETDYVQGYTELAPNGLVTFVDELVFHATPDMFVRKELESGEEASARARKQRWFSAGVTVAGVPDASSGGSPVNVFGQRTYRTRLQRRLSTALLEQDTDHPLPSASSGGNDGKRRFWRLWLGVVPTSWHEELIIARPAVVPVAVVPVAAVDDDDEADVAGSGDDDDEADDAGSDDDSDF